MTREQIKKIEQMQNKAMGLLNALQDRKLIGPYEAQVYTANILFDLTPENATEELTAFINQFNRMI